MPDHHTIAVTGKVTHVFGHRFVVETDRGAVLADLTPKGAEQHSLRIGEVVSVQVIPRPHEELSAVLPKGGKGDAVS